MRIVTCSNSCPRWDGGSLLPRSPGGLVPMVISLLEEHGGDWIFTSPPGTTATGPLELDGDIRLHPLDVDEETRRQHYDVVSIELFLGLVHYLHETSMQPVFDDAMLRAWAGYENVNRSYAKRLGELVGNGTDDLVLINDPHLMLVPEFLAAATGQRRTPMTYFLGTPWCGPDYFAILPDPIRTRILSSLLRCDVVGFHTERWVDAFLACCARFLPGVRIDGRTVHHDGQVTTMVAAPFPLDVDVLVEMRDDPATAAWANRLADQAQGRQVMVRADRLDLWKNLPRGFLAYEAMLERTPALADRYWFAAIGTIPSRATDRHRAYLDATVAVVDRINARFGRPGVEAVSMIHPGSGGDSRNCVVAALGMSRAALVNSTYDGLNLFAKEAAFLMGDGASLLLSENAGVSDQLGPFATTFNPFDVSRTSEVMEAALDGSTGSAAAGRRALLRRESAAHWLSQVFPYRSSVAGARDRTTPANDTATPAVPTATTSSSAPAPPPANSVAVPVSTTTPPSCTAV